MQKITPCLWFNDNAEEAVNFYVSLFKNSKITNISYCGEASSEVSGKPRGSVLTVDFTLDGQNFIALNDGPEFKFTQAISFLVNCKNQKEVDYLWEKLTEGGEESQCGWLKDRYGISWQIVPMGLSELLQDKNSVKAEIVMQAFLKMKKIDIKTLKNAYGQG